MMMNQNHIETEHAEPGHLSWLRIRADAETAALLETTEGSLARDCGEEIRRSLFRQLKEVSKAALDVLYYNGDIGDDEALLSRGEELVTETCPRLMDMIRQTESAFSESLSEALSRVNAYRDQISEDLLHVRCFRQVTGIRLYMGDTHNHGRQVIVFETDAGKFVYKPHTLEPDRVMWQLSETFFPGIFYVPRTVCGDGFGFCEYVENRPAHTDEEAKEYYYRLGGFCAVSRMLGSSDLHLQNFLCHDATPVPVDFEAAFSPIPRRTGELPFVENSLIDTLYGASLLPGLSLGHERSLLFDISDMNVSAPVIDGERKTLKYYFDSFICGFRDIYRQGMIQQEELLAFALKLGNFPVRVIPRATAGYMKLLQRTRQWKWVCNPGLEAEVKRVLAAAAVNGYVPGEGQVDSETSAILRGDIPYFTVQMDGNDLCDPDGIAESDCAAESPREHLLQCLRLLSEPDLDFHCRLFRLALSKMLYPRHLPEPQIRLTQPLGDEECARRAEAIAEQVLDELLPGPRGGLCCFTLFTGREDAMEIAPFDLKHGRHGIGIFLAAMLKNSTNADLNARMQEALDMIVSGMCEESAMLLNGKATLREDMRSFSTGIAGYLFAADLIWCYTGNEACRRLLGELAQYRSEIQVKKLLTGGAEQDEQLASDADSDVTDMLLPVDSLDGGNCAAADSLLEAGRRLNRTELMQKSRELLTAMTIRADVSGGYRFVPPQFAPILIPGLFSGISGVGYTLLRQVDPELLSVML